MTFQQITLWWTNIAMENHHFHGKIHYFYGHVQLLFVSSPEGTHNVNPIIHSFHDIPTNYLLYNLYPLKEYSIESIERISIERIFQYSIIILMISNLFHWIPSDFPTDFIISQIVKSSMFFASPRRGRSDQLAGPGDYEQHLGDQLENLL